MHTVTPGTYSWCYIRCFTFCTKAIIVKTGTALKELCIFITSYQCDHTGLCQFQSSNRTCSHSIIAVLLQTDCMVTGHFSFQWSASIQLWWLQSTLVVSVPKFSIRILQFTEIVFSSDGVIRKRESSCRESWKVLRPWGICLSDGPHHTYARPGRCCHLNCSAAVAKEHCVTTRREREWFSES